MRNLFNYIFNSIKKFWYWVFTLFKECFYYFKCKCSTSIFGLKTAFFDSIWLREFYDPLNVEKKAQIREEMNREIKIKRFFSILAQVLYLVAIVCTLLFLIKGI